MKGLVTSGGTAIAAGGFQPVAVANVPATSWFPNKVIILRCALSTIITGIGGPVVANIQERITITGGNIWAIPNPGATTYNAGNGSIWREFRLIRIDPNVVMADFNQSMVHGAANAYTGTSYVATIGPSGASYNFGAPIVITYQVSVPGPLGASSVASAFVNGLLEQGTNLGKIF